jgi:hypothetical protein
MEDGRWKMEDGRLCFPMLAYTKIKWKEKLALGLHQVWMFV